MQLQLAHLLLLPGRRPLCCIQHGLPLSVRDLSRPPHPSPCPCLLGGALPGRGAGAVARRGAG